MLTFKTNAKFSVKKGLKNYSKMCLNEFVNALLIKNREKYLCEEGPYLLAKDVDTNYGHLFKKRGFSRLSTVYFKMKRFLGEEKTKGMINLDVNWKEYETCKEFVIKNPDKKISCIANKTNISKRNVTIIVKYMKEKEFIKEEKLNIKKLNIYPKLKEFLYENSRLSDEDKEFLISLFSKKFKLRNGKFLMLNCIKEIGKNFSSFIEPNIFYNLSDNTYFKLAEYLLKNTKDPKVFKDFFDRTIKLDMTKASLIKALIEKAGFDFRYWNFVDEISNKVKPQELSLFLTGLKKKKFEKLKGDFYFLIKNLKNIKCKRNFIFFTNMFGKYDWPIKTDSNVLLLYFNRVVKNKKPLSEKEDVLNFLDIINRNLNIVLKNKRYLSKKYIELNELEYFIKKINNSI